MAGSDTVSLIRYRGADQRNACCDGKTYMLTLKQNATPNVDVPDEVIEGFPEFAFTLSDPNVKRKMRDLAKSIVASHQTSKRIVGFEVHGHADVTLRLPPGPEREQTENEVSRDRAENARQMLLDLIQEEGGAAILGGIRANASARSFGSRFTKFTPAENETERKQNRRVEIFLKTFEAPPAPVDKGIQTVTLWLNAFIHKNVSNSDGTQMSFALTKGPHAGSFVIPGPFNGKVPGFDDCYLTDERGFDSTNKLASARIHAEVVVDFTGPVPAIRPFKPLGATVDTIRVRVSTGEELNRGRGIARGGFSQGPGFVPASKRVEVRFAIAGSNPIAKMPRVVVVPIPGLPIPVPRAPSSSDPPSLADPDIDMVGSFVIDAQTRKLKFRGLVDGFPFFEGYISVDSGSTQTIFRLSPEPGSSPASGLPGPPNRAVEKDLTL
jgi:outer membrane protein OmpA-like peptidoglycan-associated protein